MIVFEARGALLGWWPLLRLGRDAAMTG
jgi:hypothetical protein